MSLNTSNLQRAAFPHPPLPVLNSSPFEELGIFGFFLLLQIYEYKLLYYVICTATLIVSTDTISNCFRMPEIKFFHKFSKDLKHYSSLQK